MTKPHRRKSDMEQTVTVKTVYPDGTAEVLLNRPTACGGNCRDCGGCGRAGQLHQVRARNPIGAGAGDRVILTTGTGRVMRAVAAVYLLPAVLLLVGALLYGLPAALAGLILGFVPALLLNRRAGKNSIPFVISAYAPE